MGQGDARKGQQGVRQKPASLKYHPQHHRKSQKKLDIGGQREIGTAKFHGFKRAQPKAGVV